MDLIKLAVSQTNTAFSYSEVHTQLRLVHAYRHPDYVENVRDICSDCEDMHDSLLDHITRKDGKMDDVHDLRKQYKADLVAILYDDPAGDWSNTCGIAWLGGSSPTKSLMFSATQFDCIDGYTFAHEVGHNLGCAHDRGTGRSCNQAGYNYGYRNPEAKFNTIGACTCRMNQCDNMPKNRCPKIQRISNPNVKYMGDPTGTATENCARIINENRKTIAAFYKSNQQNPVVPSSVVPPVMVKPPTKTPVPPTPPPVMVTPPTDNGGDDWGDWGDDWSW